MSKTPMISIVDDDESVRESTKSLLRSIGYAARVFASAEEFLNSNPDDTSCLILDVQMEGLSGVELQERLIAEGRRTPIIFITAFTDDGTEPRARCRGDRLPTQAVQRREAHPLYRFRSRAIRVLTPPLVLGHCRHCAGEGVTKDRL